MSWVSFELEKEIDEYEVTGPNIHRAGYQAGVRGLPVSLSPHPTGNWKDDIWCQGWRRGQMEKLYRESAPDFSFPR